MVVSKIKTAHIAVDCKPELLHALKIYAIQREATLSKIAIEAWEEYLAKPEVKAALIKPVLIPISN
jgi:hypothetical protein